MIQHLAGLVLLAAVLAAAAACDSETMTSTPAASTEGSTPTPEPWPVKPVDEDGDIWDIVVTRVSGNISPVLRPAELPDGFETVTIGAPVEKVGAHLFVVEYAGPGKVLRIGAGAFNPPPPDLGGHQEAVKLRGLQCVPEKGKECALQINDDANPSERVWVWWNEPGTWLVDGGEAPLDSVFYLVVAEGLDPQQVIAVVESLQPADLDGS